MRHQVARHAGVRTDRHKLIHFYTDDTWEFYDLEADPQEFRNVYADSAYADVGAACAQTAAQAVPLFRDPDASVDRIAVLLWQRRLALADELALADGRTSERDFVPINPDAGYGGHLWVYRDVTEQKRAEQELRRRDRLL